MNKKNEAIKMLILDPSSNDAEQTINILRNNGHAVRATQILTEEDLEQALEKQSWDLFVVRDNLENPSAEQALKIVQHYGAEITFIMTTPNYSVERTVEALRLGIKDVVPEDNDEYFKLVVERELMNIDDRQRRKSSENALRETDKRNELLLDSSRDAIAYITDGMHIYANHAYIELFGYSDAEDLECMPVMDLMDSDVHDEFKIFLKEHTKTGSSKEFTFVGLKNDGSSFEAILSLTNSQYDGEDCIQVYIKTVEANDEELEQKLKEISAKDRLTGLFNQHYFVECLETSINKASSENQLSAVFYIELDNFDSIQDEHGISNSNLYLKEVSGWLKLTLPDSTTLARLGDNTFAVLLEIKKPDDASSIATELAKEFSENLFEVSDHTIKDTISIGICPVQESSPNADKVISNAHFAATRVHSKGGNGIRMHDNSLDALDNRQDAQVAMELQDAIDADRVHVMYEPIVKFQGSVEQIFHARLTVDTEKGNDLLIGDVYDIDHKTSTANLLDNYLLDNAFQRHQEYLSDNPECLLKIQMSTASLLDENIANHIQQLLSEHSLNPESIILEFREEDVVAHLKRAIKTISELAEHNIMTSMCGFGGTLDSESVVNAVNCPLFNWLSIDSAFFANFLTDTDAQNKVQELVSFAQANELVVIAPSISDPGSIATLWPMNVDHIHGEYIAAPSHDMDFDFTEVSF